MSKKKKIIIVCVFFILIAIFVAVNLMKSKGGQIEVQIDKVKRGDITEVVSGSGKVTPETEVKISANVSAEITGLYVKEGDKVEKNQLLVELDRKRLEAAFERAKSNKKSSEASLKKAQSDYKRALDLFKQNLLSLAEKESAEASLLLAESNVEQADATLRQAEDDLNKTRIYSPINGTVSQLNKELGEIALGSTFQADVIMIVADLTRMEVVSEIDENDVVSISIGDTANIEVDAIPDTTFKGVVSEIAHTATTRGFGTQEEVTNFEVKVAIVNPSEKLRPGMSSTVDIETETHKNVLHVPIQSVTVRMPEEIKGYANSDSTKKDEKTEKKSSEEEEKMIEVIFIVKEDSAKIVPVETGISNDESMEIKSGVEEGVQVVTGSYRVLSKTLKDGSLIKVAKDKGKDKSEK